MSKKWAAEADEIDQDGDFCCAQTRRHDAGELFELLRKSSPASPGPTPAPEGQTPDWRKLVSMLVMAEDTDEDFDRIHAYALARKALGLKLADGEDDEDAAPARRPARGPAMTPMPVIEVGRRTLECPCCGDDGAVSDAGGMFYDGWPLICGCTGVVSVDEDGEPWINNLDEPCPKGCE